MILQIKYGCQGSLTEKVTFEQRCKYGQDLILKAISRRACPAGAAASAMSLVQKSLLFRERWGGHCDWRRGNKGGRWKNQIWENTEQARSLEDFRPLWRFFISSFTLFSWQSWAVVLHWLLHQCHRKSLAPSSMILLLLADFSQDRISLWKE